MKQKIITIYRPIKTPTIFKNIKPVTPQLMKKLWVFGTELQNIFSEIAVANPGKYPVKETHGHAVPLYEERIRRYQ